MYDALTLSILGILVLGLGGIFYYLKKMIEENQKELKHLKAVVNKISVDFMIERMLDTPNKEQFKKNALNMGEKIFEFLKKKYSIEATTFMEMKKKLEETDSIPPEEKEEIMEFLENMIYLEYSPKGVTPRRREKMKEILMKMVRKIGGPNV